MLRNYLTTAWRNLLRQRLYAVINVVGLALGMASCIVLYLYVQHELSYDRYHANAERLYRIVSGTSAATSLRLAPFVENHFGEQVVAGRLTREARTFVGPGGDLLREGRVLFADPSIFEIFSFSVLQGDPAAALVAPDALVVTDRMALKYLGGIEAVGQTLIVDGTPRRVAAVVGVPSNSHLQFDFVLPMAAQPESWLEMPWFVNAVTTYVVLPEGWSVPQFAEEVTLHVRKAADRDVELTLQRVTDIHLRSHLKSQMGANGDIRNVYLVSAIAAVVLLLACINFVNLSTARLGERAREAGVRKVVGAGRRQLILQFLGESLLMAALSLALACVLVEAALPMVNPLLRTDLSVPYGAWHLLAAYATLVICVGLGAGGPAALAMASYQPAAALSGQSRQGAARGSLRGVLVVIQFTASISLMACGAIIHQQLSYLQSKDLGFDSDGVTVVDNSWNVLGDRYAVFKTGALTHPGVLSVSAGEPPGFFVGRSLVFPQPDGTEVHVRDFEGDHDYLETLGLRLVAGRGFPSAGKPGAADECVVNEAYTRAFPGDHGELARGEGFCREVVGVVAEFPAFSLREEMDPVSILLRPGAHPTVLVRVDPRRAADAISHLKGVWEELVPGRPFEHSLLTDDLAALYSDERELGRLIAVFTGLALVIGCLGMFGLAAHTAASRTKEVGVRRVLGASVAGVAWLMTHHFVRLVVVSTVLACPIALASMQRWLQAFAHRTEIGAGIFVACGGLALALAVATVASQSARAAMVNPVKALRCE